MTLIDDETGREYGRPADTEALSPRPVAMPYHDPHPEPGPCPPWCWVVNDASDPHHGVDVQCKGAIGHSSAVIRTLATLYDGYNNLDENIAEFASVEVHLEQDGDHDPVVDIGPRQYTHPGRKHEYDIVLRLTIPDAEDLIRVLSHLAESAKRGQR